MLKIVDRSTFWARMNGKRTSHAIIEDNLRITCARSVPKRFKTDVGKSRGQDGSGSRCSAPISKTSSYSRTCFEPFRGTMRDGTRVSIDSLKLLPSSRIREPEKKRRQREGEARLLVLYRITTSRIIIMNRIKLRHTT